MKKYIAIMAGIILLVFIVENAYGDWIDYMDWRIDSHEVLGVCVYEPEEENIKKLEDSYITATFSALINWEEKLANYTNGNNFQMELTYITKETHNKKFITDFDYCNVHISFWNERHESVTDTAIGVTYYEGIARGREMVSIEVYPMIEAYFAFVEDGKDYTAAEIEQMKIPIIHPMPPTIVYNTVAHEFGHAIGLGHMCDEPLGHGIKSMMAPQISTRDETLWEITDYDLAAVYQLYGEEGWKSNKLVLQKKYGSASAFFDGIDVNCTFT